MSAGNVTVIACDGFHPSPGQTINPGGRKPPQRVSSVVDHIDPPNRWRNWMKSLAATAPSLLKSRAALTRPTHSEVKLTAVVPENVNVTTVPAPELSTAAAKVGSALSLCRTSWNAVSGVPGRVTI